MGAIKNIWTILEGEKKVREFAESFGPGMPIMSNITAYYKKKDQEKEDQQRYEQIKKEYYMQKRIEEEYEREHGRR